jgi:tetratricopeptide (TPR) repeat protein
MLGYNKHALRNFKLSIEHKFREVESIFLMAILYSEKNLFDEALENIDKGKKIQKKKIIMDKLTTFQIHEMIGWVYYKKNDTKTAWEYYEKVIPVWNKYFKRISTFHLGERFSPIYYHIGIIYKLKNNLQKSKEYYEKSMLASPNSIFAQKSRKELEKL